MIDPLTISQMKKHMPGWMLLDWLLLKEQTDLTQRQNPFSLFSDKVGDWFLDIIIDKKLDSLASIAIGTDFIQLNTQHYEDLCKTSRTLSNFYQNNNPSDIAIYLGNQFEIFEHEVADYMMKLNPDVLKGNINYMHGIIPLLGQKQQEKIAYRISDMSSPNEISNLFSKMYRISNQIFAPLMSLSAQRILLDKLDPYEIDYLINHQSEYTGITSDLLNEIEAQPMPKRQGPNPNMDINGIEYKIVG